MGRSEGVFVPTTRYRGFDVGKAARLHVGMRPMARAQVNGVCMKTAVRARIRASCLRPPRCVSTGPEVVRLAGMANERERVARVACPWLRVVEWLCVSPGWQMNVNVNVYRFGPVYRYVTNSSQGFL